MDIVLIEDSREQNGYSALFNTPCIRSGLDVGDYSIVGLEDRIAIERKSLEDLVGSLTTGRKRFEQEFKRARCWDYFGVVIEARLYHLLSHDYRSNATPQAIFESVNSWSVKYGRPFLFCENRTIAAQVTESLLLKYVRRFEQTLDNVKSAMRKLDAPIRNDGYRS